MKMEHSAAAQNVTKKIESIIQSNLDHHIGPNLLCVRAFPKEGPPIVSVNVYWESSCGEDQRISVDLNIDMFVDDMLTKKFEYLKKIVKAIVNTLTENVLDIKPLVFSGNILEEPEIIQ